MESYLHFPTGALRYLWKTIKESKCGSLSQDGSHSWTIVLYVQSSPGTFQGFGYAIRGRIEVSEAPARHPGTRWYAVRVCRTCGHKEAAKVVKRKNGISVDKLKKKYYPGKIGENQ